MLLDLVPAGLWCRDVAVYSRRRKPPGQERVRPEVLKRRELTQTSPKTSCLRVSLRQGNLAGAKRLTHLSVCLCWFYCVSWADAVRGGFPRVDVRRFVMDKTRWGGFPPFVWKCSSNASTHTHTHLYCKVLHWHNVFPSPYPNRKYHN